jgi:hypothetical protein
VPGQRQPPLAHAVPDDLVDRVVPADVLAQGDQLAVHREQPGRVQSAGLVEHLLGRAQPVGQREQRRQRQPEVVPGHVVPRPGADRVDAGLAAHPAGARRVEVAVQRGVRRLHAGREVASTTL